MTFRRKQKTKIKDIPASKLPPKVKRKPPTLKEQVEILARQAMCALSGEPLGTARNIEWHHNIEVGLGGDNSVDNWQAVLKKPHRIKTSGTKATSAGSSTHKVAHVKQIIAKGMDHDKAMSAKTVGNKGHAAYLERMRAAGKPVPQRRV